MYRLIQLLVFVSLTVVSISSLSLNDHERAILNSIEGSRGEALNLLEESVNINSDTLNLEGVASVGDLFAMELEALGFATEWVDGAPFDRAGHLVARRPGTGAKVLLIGHLDTVFAKGSPFQRYELLDEHHAKGPGVTDMKGGNVVMIYALRALLDAGLLDKLGVTVVMTGDEERRGYPREVANSVLVAAAKWADYALGFEDGDGDPTTAVVARRSSGSWMLEVTGKPAHSSQIFRDDIGYGAIFESARILDQWREALGDVPNLTFNPGLMVGGTEVVLDSSTASGDAFGKNNVIPQSVRVSGGIRALSAEQLIMAQQRMQEIVADSLPHTGASVSFQNSYPPMSPSPGNERLLGLYSAISEELGYGPVIAVDPRRAGAADISFAAAHVEMALDGLGLMGEGGHTVEETADLRTLTQQTARAALLLHRLADL